MNKVIYVVLLLLVGCAQLKGGQLQSVVTKDFKNHIYYTTCSGAVEGWGSCHDKARAKCTGDYITIEKFETPSMGVRRELTFQCKK